MAKMTEMAGLKATLATSPAAGADAPAGVTTVGEAVRAGAVAHRHLVFAVGLVFLLSNALFAVALRPVPAALALVGCAGIAALLWRPRGAGALLSAPLDLPLLAGCLAFGLAFCLLGGEGHVFFSTTDWLVRDAVLADLVENGFAVPYRHDGQDYLLRAPLGMYALPAMAGRLWGLRAAHAALLTQNAFLVGAIAYFVLRLANVRRAPMLLLFFAFSGADIVPILLAEAIEVTRNAAFMPFVHIEWWGDYYSDLQLQYSSHVTQWFWVPNHTAPAWWFATLALLHRRGEIELGALLAACAAMLFWSPLAMMGAAPFVAMFALAAPRALLRPRLLAAVAAGLCLTPIAFYLTRDAGAVPHELLLAREGFLWRWLAFLAVELPQAAVIAYAWRKVDAADRPLLILAFALLIVIPFYKIGAYNDFVMRVSIPSLFFVAFAFSRIAASTPRDNGPFATLIGTIVILGVATPMLEIKQAFQPSYAISDCNLATAWRKEDPDKLPTNYWARVETIPAWLLALPASAPLVVEDRKCWPDHPLLREEMK